uniref:Uncharacterized protein n=1 Tax=Tanacetum cinerariifolium TaxID=118510 RepID=A0A699KR22_TANCI|nr:hypothetical protein [Tanacetum cinerariifolium]
MLDSDESGVTYTDISSPFEELSDIGSLRADDHEHLMLPEMLEDPYVEVALQAPPSPDYIPGPEEPEQAPPSPDYVPGPEHADDEIVAEEQPYAEDASPIAQSPEYVPESNFEAHPEDDDDEDPEEDPVDYLADGGDDEEESSEDDDMDVEADNEEEEEEEHPAPADSRLDIALGPRYEVGESSFAAARPAGGLRANYGFVATVYREIMRDPEREVGYRITDSWDEIVETLQGAPVSTDTELGGYVREFETRVRQDTDEIYMRLDDRQTERWLLAGRLNMLFRDRRAHVTDHRRQTVISELLRIDHRRSIEISELRTALQGQVTALQAHVTTLQGQQGLAGGPIQSELPEEAGGSA